MNNYTLDFFGITVDWHYDCQYQDLSDKDCQWDCLKADEDLTSDEIVNKLLWVTCLLNDKESTLEQLMNGDLSAEDLGYGQDDFDYAKNDLAQEIDELQKIQDSMQDHVSAETWYYKDYGTPKTPFTFMKY